MDKLKVIKHYSNYVRGIKVYYIKCEGFNDCFMTFSKQDYDKIIKKGYLEL